MSDYHIIPAANKGEHNQANSGFYIANGPQYIFIGSHVHLVDVMISACLGGEVIIGHYAFFGHGCMVLARGHDYSKFGIDRHRAIIAKPIIIGEGAWIGSGAILLGGARIGNHAVVTAGSVVYGEVPDYALFGGNPARFVKTIPHDEERKFTRDEMD